MKKKIRRRKKTIHKWNIFRPFVVYNENLAVSKPRKRDDIQGTTDGIVLKLVVIFVRVCVCVYEFCVVQCFARFCFIFFSLLSNSWFQFVLLVFFLYLSNSKNAGWCGVNKTKSHSQSILGQVSTHATKAHTYKPEV